MSKIPLDKFYHIVAGFIITFLVTVATKNPAQGLMAGVAAGAIKEGYDFWDNKKRVKAGKEKRHTVEFLDFAYTGGGSVLGVFVSYFFLSWQ